MDPTNFTISLNNLVQTHQKSKQLQDPPVHKPHQPNVYKETAARKNYLQESMRVETSRQQRFKAPRKVYHESVKVAGYRSNATADQLCKMSEIAQPFQKRANTTFVQKPQGINFFDPKQVVQGDVMEIEKQQANKLSKFGRCTARGEDHHDIEISTNVVQFTCFAPGNQYVQKFSIINPATTSKRVQIIPPHEPFSIRDISFQLKPGDCREIAVIFKPTSLKPIVADFSVSCAECKHIIQLSAQIETGQFIIDNVIIDGSFDRKAEIKSLGTDVVPVDDELVASTETTTRYVVDVGQLNKLYDKPHVITLGIKNFSDKIVRSQSKYGYDKQVKINNELHINNLEIFSVQQDRDIMDIYIMKEQCIQCDFSEPTDFSKKENENTKPLSKYQQFLQYEQQAGIFDNYEIKLSKHRKEKVNMEEVKSSKENFNYQFKLLPDGVIVLELEFNDNLRMEDENIIRITTSEHLNCEILIKGFVLEGSVEIVSIGGKNISNKVVNVDLNNNDFETTYLKTKRLQDFQLIPINTMIDIQEQNSQIIPISFKTQGISFRQVCFQLKKYSQFQAVGYLSDNNTNVYEDQFVSIDKTNLQSDTDNLISIQLNYSVDHGLVQSISDASSKKMLPNFNESQSKLQVLNRQKFEIQRAILDMCIQYNQNIYSIYRFVIQINPVYPNFSSLLLSNQALQLQQQINVIEKQSTDYLLISEPALDLKVIQIQSGASFQFEVKNCSQNCFIPFIVSTNLHATSTSLISKPHSQGVRFLWNKPDEIIESELRFPDVMDIMDIKKMREINELLGKSQNGFPQNYQQLKQLNQPVISARPTSRIHQDKMKQFNMPQSNMRKDSNIIEPEPVVAYPQSGILPPQTSITINVQVHPLSLGPIQGFIVINTPSTKYYEGTIVKLHDKLKEIEVRESLSKPKPLTGSKRSVLSSVPGSSQMNNRSVPVLQNLPKGQHDTIQDPTIYLTPQFTPNVQHQFEILRQKLIPTAEFNVLFQNLPVNPVIDGGFLSERDVTCRIYGLVAVPQLQFASETYQPESDQQKPLKLILENQGATSTDCMISILTGDAKIIPDVKLPHDLSPAAIVVWEKKTQLHKDLGFHVEADSTNDIWILPGTVDSLIIVKKEASSFGPMKQVLDPNLIDSDNNVVLAATRVQKRLEPMKPYVFLETDPGSKYIVLSPNQRNMKPLYINTRPYFPNVFSFILINPAAVAFNCEVSTGPDVIAPSIIKLAAQSKCLAKFAINSDHSGELETFITFHDINMRIIVNSFGPDIHIRSNYIKNSERLIEQQGMMDKNANKKAHPSLQWDNLVNEIPTSPSIVPLKQEELVELVMIEKNKDAQETKQNIVVSDPPKIMDYTVLERKSMFSDVLNGLPSIILPNIGGQESKAINITITNPTGSKILIQPKIVSLQQQFLKLGPTINYKNQFKLSTSGLFYNSESTEQSSDAKFVVGQEKFEIPSCKSQDLQIKAYNQEQFGRQEALLKLNGLFVKLISDRQPPHIILGDRLEYVALNGQFGKTIVSNFDLVSLTQNSTRLQLDTDYPLQINVTEPFLLAGLQQQNFEIKIADNKVLEFFKLQRLDSNFYKNLAQTSIDEVMRRELLDQMLSSEIRVQFVDCISNDQIYVQCYPVIIKFIVPKVKIYRKIVQFPLTFRYKVSNIQYKLENPCNIDAKWKIIHVPIQDAITSQRNCKCDINLDMLENSQQMQDNIANNQAQYIMNVLPSIKGTFTDLQQVFYDSVTNTIILDQPNIFEFGLTNGIIPANQNKNPNKFEPIEIRFHPTESHLDFTRDRKYEIQYRSIFYVVVEDGQGAWFQCSGQVNQNVDMI